MNNETPHLKPNGELGEIEAPFKEDQKIDTGTSLESTDIDPLEDAGIETPVVSKPKESTHERELEVDPMFINDSTRVTLSDPVYDTVRFPKQVPVALVPLSASELEKRIDRWPQFESPTEELQQVLANIWDSAARMLPKGIFENTIEQEGRQWEQSVLYEGKNLEIGSPGVKDVPLGTILSGDKASQATNLAMGVGTLVQTPLWHSGFWIWLKPPTTAQLLDLDELISSEKISLGRNKLGLPFSNSTVYIVNHLSDFVLQQIYDTTLSDQSPENILKRIKITDWFRIVHTLSVSIYPNGFTMEIPCVADIERCQHSEQVNVNLAKLFWTDRLALTDAQVKHMSQRRGTMSNESIDAYLNTGRFNSSKTIQINDKIKLVLKVPSLHEYLTAGMNWIDGIVESVERMFAEKTGDSAKRERIMLRHAEVSALREYEHWIEKIILNDTAEIKDKDIPKQLEIISTDAENGIALRKGIADFIDEVTISIIATPRYKCPKCNNFSNKGNEVDRHPFLIPLDPAKLFFILGDRRLSRTNTN